MIKLNEAGAGQAIQEALGARQLPDSSRELDREGLVSAAREFESLFVKMMLKNMRAAGLSEGLFENRGTEIYYDMFDKEVAREMASSQELGIAKMLVQQLGGGDGTPNSDAGSLASRLGTAPIFKSHPISAAPSWVPSIAPAAADIDATEFSASPVEPVRALQDARSPSRRFDDPDAFVSELWAAARAPAQALGVSPDTLIAQSALETGWGKHIPLKADGSSSHNLFGIKAGTNWDGATVTKMTLEYVDGIATRRADVFRAYDSYEQSFTDYVRLIGQAPRYKDALEAAGNPAEYFNELQNAGYATDPIYARKALSVLQGETMQHALKQLGRA